MLFVAGSSVVQGVLLCHNGLTAGTWAVAVASGAIEGLTPRRTLQAADVNFAVTQVAQNALFANGDAELALLLSQTNTVKLAHKAPELNFALASVAYQNAVDGGFISGAADSPQTAASTASFVMAGGPGPSAAAPPVPPSQPPLQNVLNGQAAIQAAVQML